MNDLLFARWQMAFSLGFHILFAAAGIAMPLLMVCAEGVWLRTREDVYLKLAKSWAKGTAILFAVGAVSGTVLSFELGLLWPKFMSFSGGIIGLPFGLEGFAFFTEAIFLGIYLYGWNRVSPLAHWLAGVAVAFSGMISAVFVITVNAWMNAPTGFTHENGVAANVDPVAAMLNPMSFSQSLHMVIAAYASIGFAVAGIHAFMLLRRPASAFHRAALTLALWMGGTAALLQPLSGDLSAQAVAMSQPAKLAALEGQFKTERGAPLRIGGIPNADTRETPHAIEIPRMLSFLAYHDFDATVTGLEAFPRDQWPPVRTVHLAFQAMVALGMSMVLVTLWSILLWFRKRPQSRSFLRAVVAVSPAGLLAIEAGWVVTEVGRQPWLIQGVMRTSEAVTPMPGVGYTFALYMALYLFLAAIVIWLLFKQVAASGESGEHGAGESKNSERFMLDPGGHPR